MSWPAILSGPAAQLLSVCHQLENTQWLGPERLLSEQFRQLGHLVRHARATVGPYEERLSGLDGDPTPESWRRVPVLTRAELQDLGDSLLSTTVPPGHGKVTQVSTSGSSGLPVTVTKTSLALLVWNAITVRDHVWHERPVTGRLAAIRLFKDREATAYPDGAVQGSWGAPMGALVATGPTARLDIGTTVTHQLEWLQRQNPDYLVTFPSNARALAEQCLATGVRLDRLRHLSTVSEVVDDATRAACAEAWGVRVCDLYSTQEVGYIALQCPKRDHYHVQAESAYVEILREDGEPCAPGEVGRVVVTPLHSFAMPLLRYAVGDYAEVGEPCDCGRGAPVIRRVLGRVRNMLTLPSGEQVWPLTPGIYFRELAPVKQWQIVQTSLDRLEARLVVERALTGAEEDAVRAILQEKLGHPFDVVFSYHDRLERSAGGKFEDFSSQIGAVDGPPEGADEARPGQPSGFDHSTW